MKSLRKIILLFLISGNTLFSQEHLSGKIIERNAQGKEVPLPMAGVKWLHTKITAMSDDKGEFHIAYPDSFPAWLIVSMIGYKTDTLVFKDNSKAWIKIILAPEATMLGSVTVQEKISPSSNLLTTEINTEKITSKELTLAACCNLSESFERNASVDIVFTDAVSGTKQIQMLGLDGIYTQILYENLPFVRGLSSSHGLSYVPGSWVENILVTKGTGSVVNGFEAISGQIQIEMLEPDKADRFFVNAYANNEQRYELNAHLAHRFKENLSTLTFLHGSQNKMSMDYNDDSFLDSPLKTQYNVFNRWNYRIKDKAEGQFGVRAIMEERTGGQLNHHVHGSNMKRPYIININSRQLEGFTKNGFLFPEKPWKSIAIITTERYHKQNAVFGNKTYNGEQKSFYLNTIWQDIVNNTFHKIKFGGSLLMDDYKERFSDSSSFYPSVDTVFNSREIIPGGYVEYTFNNDTNLSVVSGLRADFLDNYGLMVNPRMHFKYNPSEETALRLSGGRGFRIPHVFAENSQLFAGSRQVIMKEMLAPEIAWNYGITFTYCFMPWGREASVNFDLFRTDFENQVVIDMEDPNQIQFYNLKGWSYSNSFQTDISISPFERFDIKLAYKYYDVKTDYNGTILSKPFVPRNRALLTLDYATNKEKWSFNFTIKWFGQSRLPSTSANTPEFQRPDFSDSYFTVMGQISKKYRRFEAYLGSENMFNYTIPNPIIDPENPFGNNFDAALIWGPVTGRVIYAGFRYRIS